jgi:riboflavin kinase/FMN adenylyltransferase
MQTFRHLDELPADFGPTITTVGNFDGVHLAHQAVLRAIAARARHDGARSLAVTFDPHPMRILRPDAAPRLLTPLDVKLRLIAETGIDATLVLPFSRDLSLLGPREFAEQILCGKLRVREVHEGFNFRFGRNAEGGITALEQFGGELGFRVHVYPEMRVRGDAVSSSRIRALLRDGNVTRARRLLGRWFTLASVPGRGRGYGHKYTVPTINLSRYDELVPFDGVYVTCTRISGEQFESVTNIGMRPTFGGDSFAIESHLLHFRPIEITAETETEISFLYRLRPEIKFPSVEALRQQIGRDVARSEHYFRMTAPMPDE